MHNFVMITLSELGWEQTAILKDLGGLDKDGNNCQLNMPQTHLAQLLGKRWEKVFIYITRWVN